ncbi:MAG: S9 family peptidase [Bryobacteraceae bacterium]
MRFVWVLIATTALRAEFPSLERLYTRPYMWGTLPDRLEWSRQGHTLAFLWNEQGNRFLDLYAYHPDQNKRVRLTDLTSFQDELLTAEDDKDSRLKGHKMPDAGLGSFALSYDGTQAAFAYKGDLFIVPTDGSKPPFRLTRTKAGESQPKFSPDGKKLASNRGGQVVVQDLGNGQLWQVTDVEGGRLAAYEWSDDGRMIAYMVRRGNGRTMPLPNYSGRFVTAGSFTRQVAGDDPTDFAFYVVPAQGGKATALEKGSISGRTYPNFPVWSPDSTKLLMVTSDALRKRIQIAVADAKTGKAKIVSDESDPAWIYDSEAGWSPDSKQVWFTSERDGFAHLYRVPAAGGAITQVTKGNFEVRGEMFTHPPQWIGDWLYFSSTEDATSQRQFYRIKPDGTGKEKLSKRTGINDGLTSEDGKHVAWRLADLDNPFDLWVGENRVTTSAKPEFHTLSWPKTQFVSFPSEVDKQTVKAKILLPPGYTLTDRSKKWPCVFFIHGAGYATSVLEQWGSYNVLRYVYNAYLANQGYVIMDLDYRGSTGYGRAWRAGVYLHMGGPDLEDVLGAVDYMGSLGNIDMDRLGIWGVSYGGFMTNMAMFLSPDTFKAGSGWASVNDWENYNEGYTVERLHTPTRYPEAYRRSSPILFSHKVKNHLLIVHGMVDSNVLFQDAVQLSEKMIQEGKDFGQIFYPEEDHGFVRDESWIDALRRTTEWFARYLR